MTLVRAIEKQHLFKPDTNLRAWLFTLLHNQHVNEVRRATKWGNPVNFDDASRGLVSGRS
jgi:RNA polymerase sigma-70 factor (ECF subfamily)